MMPFPWSHAVTAICNSFTTAVFICVTGSSALLCRSQLSTVASWFYLCLHETAAILKYQEPEALSSSPSHTSKQERADTFTIHKVFVEMGSTK